MRFSSTDLTTNEFDPRMQSPISYFLFQLNDMEMLADLVASTFVNDPLRRQRVLEEVSLNRRLRLLIQYLHDEIGSAVA